MDSVPHSDFHFLWLLNMESQRNGGRWIGAPPFMIDKEPNSTMLCLAKAQECSQLPMPADAMMQCGKAEVAGIYYKVDARTRVKQASLEHPLGSSIPSLGNPSCKSKGKKVERQKERRREKREQGPDWRGRRDSVEGRIYSKEQRAFIAICHHDWADHADTKGKPIPLRELAQLFNKRFRERPARTQSSLASLIGRDGGLSRLRDSLK
ncbi:unnamed protein product [Cercospora beticola]|nr:unnamed protein product [Cercospora beticola]